MLATIFKMKLLLIIFLFFAMPDNDFDKLEVKNEFDLGLSTCQALDFMKLKEKGLQNIFFIKLDSIRKVQNPNNDQDTKIMVDLNKTLLAQFLKNIDQVSLSKTGRFEKEYHFNIAPKGYSDPKTCKDKISIEFNPELCRFIMVIWNTFLVEPNWCTEHQVVYGFEIKDDQIINFGRNMSG